MAYRGMRTPPLGLRSGLSPGHLCDGTAPRVLSATDGPLLRRCAERLPCTACHDPESRRPRGPCARGPPPPSSCGAEGPRRSCVGHCLRLRGMCPHTAIARQSPQAGGYCGAPGTTPCAPQGHTPRADQRGPAPPRPPPHAPRPLLVTRGGGGGFDGTGRRGTGPLQALGARHSDEGPPPPPKSRGAEGRALPHGGGGGGLGTEGGGALGAVGTPHSDGAPDDGGGGTGPGGGRWGGTAPQGLG